MRQLNHSFFSLSQVVLSVLGIFLGSQFIFAQCVPQRYVDDLFSVSVSSNIQYGTAPAVIFPYTNQSFTFNKNLVLDVYSPVGDTQINRPCIVMAFGGAFLGGSKTQSELVDFCQQMASKGFVVASIDYRIGFNTASTNAAIRAVYRGVQDMNAAIRFMRNNAATYGIDPALVFAGGNSAGSIAAIHAAYLDDNERAASSLLAPTYGGGLFFNWPDLGCLDCSGNTLPDVGPPAGVINLWGAIADESWILNGANTPGIASFHGGSDNIVVHDVGSPFGVAIFPALFGSTNIHNMLNGSTVPDFYSFDPNGGHELWTNQTAADAIVDASAIFLNDNYLRPSNNDFYGPCINSGVYTYHAYPNTNLQNCWDVSGGTIVSSTSSSVSVTWPASGIGTVSLRQRGANGAWSDALDSQKINVAANVILSGCYDATSGLMNDFLRQANLIPLNEPYSAMPNFVHVGGGNEVVDPSVLLTTGSDAVVDWIFLELRDASNVVVETKSALLIRDGSIVDADGCSAVSFSSPAGSYYLVVRHRNHLGTILATPIAFSTSAITAVDFTLPSANVPANSMISMGSIQALWSGDGNSDGTVIYQGSGSDILPITTAVFSNPNNASFQLTFPVFGYHNADLNMDGLVIYQGANSDILPITQSVFSNPLNGAFQFTFPVLEMVP